MWRIAESRASRLRKITRYLSLIFILLFSLMVGCSRSPTIVKVALVGPFTGRYREIGYDVIYSSRLAIRNFNQSRDESDIRLALVALDDFGEPQTAEKNAQALSLDNKVVAVVGHWLPETTQIAQRVYVQHGLPLISTGQPPFGILDPSGLPERFSSEYAQITPFDEVAGPYSASGYDALQLVIAAVEESVEQNGRVDRQSVGKILETLKIQGLNGEIYQN